MPARQEVLVFVDWNSQIGNGGQLGEERPRQRAQRVAEYVAEALVAAMPQEPGTLYRATMRLYYGWHRGLTPTDARQSLAQLKEDGLLPGARGSVAFDWINMFGDTLLDAFDHRKHPRINIHLPDTLRKPVDSGSSVREKMVDTAMACDILCSARSEPTAWRVVMSEDDDIIPPVLVAEKWSKDRGGRNYIMRGRADKGHMNISNLLLLLERAK